MAAPWSSLEWKIDWEHRYGVTSPGPREWGLEPKVEQPNPPPSTTPPPYPPSPPPPQPASSVPMHQPIPVPPRAVTQPKDSEAIEVDHGTSTSPVGLLPSVASAESPTRLLARPPLIRSETKGSAAKLAAAGQTRSETIQEARGAHFNGSPNKREGVPGRVRRNASLDFDAPPERFPVVRRIHSMDFEANELLLAPSKDSAEKNDPARRLKTEDSFDSLDFRDVLTSEWEHRYGVPSSSGHNGYSYDHQYSYSTPVDPQVVAATQAVTCAHCEDQPASVFCSSCGAVSFCHECDVVLHRAVKLRTHTRQRTWQQEGAGTLVTEPTRDQIRTEDVVGAAGGEYEIEREAIRILTRLGEGYFGVVYKGLWAGQNVAVKKLKHGSRRHVQEFRNEVLVLAKLRHPNITNFYGVTSAPDHLIVTELLHGSLYRLLHFQSTPLSLALKIRIAKDIACGAAYIHGLNPSIVHRDINSSNVLVTGDLAMLQRIVDEGRSESVAKLSDFGLSRSVERFMTQCTGNAYYLAPEVFRGQHYTEKADCYSYGVLVWELFTQRYPFSDLNPRSAAFQQSELGLRPPITDQMNVIPEALAIMQRAWQADPEARMPFKDIVLEWERVEATRFKRSASASAPPMPETRRPLPSASSGGEYVFTPLEFRKLELEQRLLRRPTIFQLMQKDIIPPSTCMSDDGGSADDSGDEMAFHSLLGYDLMRPDLMKTRAISIN